jgi:hypothetical protein
MRNFLTYKEPKNEGLGFELLEGKDKGKVPIPFKMLMIKS